MQILTDDEKAARLLFYRQQAEAQWGERDSALRSFSRPFFVLNRIGLYIAVALAPIISFAIVLLGIADHHYAGALSVAIAAPVSIPVLRLIRRGDVYPAKQSDWKPQLLSCLAFLLWWALWLGVCVISVAFT